MINLLLTIRCPWERKQQAYISLILRCHFTNSLESQEAFLSLLLSSRQKQNKVSYLTRYVTVIQDLFYRFLTRVVYVPEHQQGPRQAPW